MPKYLVLDTTVDSVAIQVLQPVLGLKYLGIRELEDVTEIGSIDATIPMLTVIGVGTSLPPSFSPLKRRASIQREEFRRRGVVQTSMARRQADEHSGESKPPR